MNKISADHFSGGRNVVPDNDATKRDLAALLIELQGAANQVARGYVQVDNTDSPYAVTTESLIGVDTTTAVVTLNLPAANSLEPGSFLFIKDEGGNATTNAITINLDGADTIDGGAGPAAIAVDSAMLILYSNGVDGWFTFIEQ